MSRTTEPDRFVVLGRITKAHGVRGAVRVQSFAESPDSLLRLEGVRLRRGKSGSRLWEVDWMQLHSKGLLLKLRGLEDRAEAEGLAGSELGLLRSELEEPEEGEYYWTDLIGLTVLDSEGREVGRVANLFDSGAHDILVVRAGDREVLIPAIPEMVAEVDLEAGLLRIEPLEGLIPDAD